MKLLVCLLGLMIPVLANAADFHISANVEADVYLDGRYCGKTPITVDLSGADVITLKREHFETAEINRETAIETRRKIMSTTSGDAPRDRFLFAVKSTPEPVSEPQDEPRRYIARNIRKNWGGILWALPLETVVLASYSAVVLPSETSRYTVPYMLEEYEPNQLYVYLFPAQRTENDERLWKISRFVVSGFKSERAEFLEALQKMTGLSAQVLSEILSENPTPDAAAGAVVRKLVGQKG